jgi:hypothetical protein
MKEVYVKYMIMMDYDAGMARPLGFDYPDAFYHALPCGIECSDIFWKRLITLNRLIC